MESSMFLKYFFKSSFELSARLLLPKNLEILFVDQEIVNEQFLVIVFWVKKPILFISLECLKEENWFCFMAVKNE